MAGLHFAQFGGYPKRWLYDLASFVMIAAGLVHFCIKLRRKHAEQRKVGAPNLAVLVGLSLACIGLLWPNRLLPVSCPSAANGVCACSFWSGLSRWAWCYGGRRCAVGPNSWHCSASACLARKVRAAACGDEVRGGTLIMLPLVASLLLAYGGLARLVLGHAAPLQAG